MRTGPPWKAINELLTDADIGIDPVGARERRLEDLAERAIRAALAALGVRADKDLFRERRER